MSRFQVMISGLRTNRWEMVLGIVAGVFLVVVVIGNERRHFADSWVRNHAYVELFKRAHRDNKLLELRFSDCEKIARINTLNAVSYECNLAGKSRFRVNGGILYGPKAIDVEG